MCKPLWSLMLLHLLALSCCSLPSCPTGEGANVASGKGWRTLLLPRARPQRGISDEAGRCRGSSHKAPRLHILDDVGCHSGETRDPRQERLQGPRIDLWARSIVAPTCLDAWAGTMWVIAGVSVRVARLPAGSNTCEFFFRGWCVLLLPLFLEFLVITAE